MPLSLDILAGFQSVIRDLTPNNKVKSFGAARYQLPVPATVILRVKFIKK